MSTYDDASLIVYPSGYKANKIYSLKPTDGSGDLTFARASTATRVNESGLIESVASGVPRIDYTGGGCGKFLFEPQRTNELTYSEDLSTNWSTAGVASSRTYNDEIGPDGTLSATYWSAIAGIKNLKQTATCIAATYTVSVYAKSKGLGNDKFQFGDGGSGSTISEVTATNEWVRYTFTYTATAGSRTIGIFQASDNSAIDVLFYGFQLELGSYPTSYIPTAGATATRVADASATTGLSSVIGQTEGVIFVDFELQTTDKDFVIMNLYNTSLPANGIYFYLDNSNLLKAYCDNSGNQALIASGVLSEGRFKAAFAYKANDFAFYLNGSLVGVDTSGTVPTCNALRLENYAVSPTPTYQEKMAVYEALIFPTRLTNAELATLTTL